MSTLRQVFEMKKPLFIPFIMGGYPALDSSVRLMLQLSEAGADIIELGVPFSDPIADGPINQLAAHTALQNGASLLYCLAQVTKFRQSGGSTPVILFSYLNPLLAMGIETFAMEAKKAGVNGVLIVDLPVEEGSEVYTMLKQNDLECVLLAAPTTDNQRLSLYKEMDPAFIYYISRLGVTGVQDHLSSHLKEEVCALRKQVGGIPIAVGFGISTVQQAAIVAEFADGVIVGSHLVKQSVNGDLFDSARELVLAIR